MDNNAASKTSKNSFQYKFYRKPSLKKKGPEVKQTRTSLARLYKSNPLLKFEVSKEKEHQPPVCEREKAQKNGILKKATKILAGNGNFVECKPGKIRLSRILSEDFHRDNLLSSTLLPRETLPQQRCNCSSNRCISACQNRLKLLLENKKNPVSYCHQYSRRRSKSLDIKKNGYCPPIEEVRLSKCNSQLFLPNETSTPCAEHNAVDPLDCANSDDSNKENLEVVDSNSYEDLHIRKI